MRHPNQNGGICLVPEHDVSGFARMREHSYINPRIEVKCIMCRNMLEQICVKYCNKAYVYHVSSAAFEITAFKNTNIRYN